MARGGDGGAVMIEVIRVNTLGECVRQAVQFAKGEIA